MRSTDKITTSWENDGWANDIMVIKYIIIIIGDAYIYNTTMIRALFYIYYVFGGASNQVLACRWMNDKIIWIYIQVKCAHTHTYMCVDWVTDSIENIEYWMSCRAVPWCDVLYWYAWNSNRIRDFIFCLQHHSIHKYADISMYIFILVWNIFIWYLRYLLALVVLYQPKQTRPHHVNTSNAKNIRYLE